MHKHTYSEIYPGQCLGHIYYLNRGKSFKQFNSFISSFREDFQIENAIMQLFNIP